VSKATSFEKLAAILSASDVLIQLFQGQKGEKGTLFDELPLTPLTQNQFAY
jgi:hypothetical protein